MSQRRVYIVGAHIPNGGTLMAYHLGLIVADYIGGEPISVDVPGTPADPHQFSYPQSITAIGLDQLLPAATDADILVMNPSFSSLWLGPRFPGFKLMYVQGYNTFSIIDRWFDSYVSVSGFICGFLKYVYDIKSSIIHPFIDIDQIKEIPEWRDRPPDKILVLSKGDQLQQSIILEKTKSMVIGKNPEIIFDMNHNRKKHDEFLNDLSTYRYVLSLSCAEGFGLMPLESMALGATLIGFDAGGGHDYMSDGENCWCTKYPDVAGLADRFHFALRNPENAEKIAASGARWARSFTYDQFRSRWIRHLENVLPHNL